MINSVREYLVADKNKQKLQPLALRNLNYGMIATLIFTAVNILMIVLQIIFLNEYDVLLLSAQTYLGYISSLGFLSFLIFWFARWLYSSRDYIIMLYTTSIFFVFLNLLISLIYLQFAFFSTSSLQGVKPYPIYSYVIMHAGLPLTESLSTLIDVLSLASFLLMWVATAVLLKQYRYKLGRIKYYILISIPLIYYLFPFQNYFGDVFFPLMLSSPLIFSTAYILIFSATKQVGALLFSLTFWTASTIVHDDRVRKSILISSIGIVILFGSVGITSLQYTVYPPFGIITVAFIPLGTYLLAIGIYASAKYISGDAKLRKEFYKSAASQLDLLKSIGVSEMEKEYENRIRYVKERFEPLEKTDARFETEMDEADVKEALHDVLNELYYSKNKKERMDS